MVKIYLGSKLFKLPLIRNYDGIVLGRRMFFKSENPSRILINHELIHQDQMDRHGVIGFYLIYIKDYVKNLFKYRDHKMAYYNIPFEAEAYRNQGRFRKQRKTMIVS